LFIHIPKIKYADEQRKMEDWKSNVMAALPAWLGLIAKKEN